MAYSGPSSVRFGSIADAMCIIGLVRFMLNSGCRGAERFPSLKLACKCYLRRYLGPNEHHLQKESLA